MRYVIIISLSLLVMLSAGCAVGEGYAAPKPDTNSVGSLGPGRQDCGQIMGTAFRSVDERHWFEANCSKWPETKFESLTAVRNQPETPECAAIRAKANPTTSERQTLQTTCNKVNLNQDPVVFAGSPGSNCTPVESSTPTSSNDSRSRSPQPSASPTPAGAPSCGPAASPTPANGDRNDCYAISGTIFRSLTEQSWFYANCMGGAPVPTVGPSVPSQQVQPSSRYCNPANPGYPNSRGRITQPC